MNHATLRELNGRIYEAARQLDIDEPADFVCECGQPTCNPTLIEIPLPEFADCLATDGCLVVATGHQPPGAEIIRSGDGYLVVRAPVVAD